MQTAKNYAEYLQAKEQGMSFDRFAATLRGATLRGADLYGADLYGADLRGADLYGADLYGADLRGVKGIGKASGLGSELREAFASTPKGAKEVMFHAGCFYGTGKELLAESEAKHGKDSEHYQAYSLFVQLYTLLLSKYIEKDETPKSE